MKSLIKLTLALGGIPVVFGLLAYAALRRMARGPQLTADEAVLVYSQVNWDEVWQRPQQFAWRSATGQPVIYCCPVQPHNLQYLRRRWRPWRRFTGERNLLVLSPLILSGHFKWNLVHRLNCRITAWHIRLALEKNTPMQILINTPLGLPVTDHLARHFQVRWLVYDVIDDFTLFEWCPAFARAMDRKLLVRANRVITGTRELATTRPGSEFIACGVDYQMFSAPAQPPADIAALPRPMLGFFGTISERIDMALLDELSNAMPHASIVMIGPVHLGNAELPKAPNIHYLGLRTHQELPAYAQAFDVALIPFRQNSVTAKLNPVKTLEYLAAGTPVVATPLPDLKRFYEDAVTLATREDFTEAVKQVLAEKPTSRIDAGIRLAKAASWDIMANRINVILMPAERDGAP